MKVLFWRWKSRPKGRPTTAEELKKLIAEMAVANITWGEERIAHELARVLEFGPDFERRSSFGDAGWLITQCLTFSIFVGTPTSFQGKWVNVEWRRNPSSSRARERVDLRRKSASAVPTKTCDVCKHWAACLVMTTATPSGQNTRTPRGQQFAPFQRYCPRRHAQPVA